MNSTFYFLNFHLNTHEPFFYIHDPTYAKDVHLVLLQYHPPALTWLSQLVVQ